MYTVVSLYTYGQSENVDTLHFKYFLKLEGSFSLNYNNNLRYFDFDRVNNTYVEKNQSGELLSTGSLEQLNDIDFRLTPTTGHQNALVNTILVGRLLERRSDSLLFQVHSEGSQTSEIQLFKLQ